MAFASFLFRSALIIVRGIADSPMLRKFLQKLPFITQNQRDMNNSLRNAIFGTVLPMNQP